MSDDPNQEFLDRSVEEKDSFQCEALEQSQDIPNFEFSSPISSISSNCSSPERTMQPYEQMSDFDDSSEFVSLEDLKSQISPPSDGECSGEFSSSKKAVVLETIYEDCYLETPPGTPTVSRPKKARRVRMNLSNFEEFKDKENVQINCSQLEEDK